MLAHKVVFISKTDPLKYLMNQPILTGRLARWAVALMEFDITYAPQKAIKGQALADFLAAHPIPDDSPLKCELPDEETLHVEEEVYWKMYFDGSSSIQPAIKPILPRRQAGVGLVFVTPEGGVMHHSLSLTEPCTNNEAEYEALITGLEMALEMGIEKLKVYGDSQLILNQVKGQFQIKNLELVKYHGKVIDLLTQFTEVILERVPRSMNGKADALAKLANELSDPDQEEIQVFIHRRRSLSPCFQGAEQEHDEEIPFEDIASLEWECKEGFEAHETWVIEEEESKDWRQPFLDYFQQGKLPENKAIREQIRK